MITTNTPTKERIAVIDVVRGFTLFGVLLINIASFMGPAKESAFGSLINDSISFVFYRKSFTMLSMLFGIGLVIQMERFKQNGMTFFQFALRRQGALLLLGVAHAVLLWSGDVLTLYALVGVFAAFVLGLRLSVPTMLAMAFALMAVHVAIATDTIHLPAFFNPQAIMARNQASFPVWKQALSAGSWTEAAAARVASWAHYRLPLMACIIPDTFASFLIGISLWKSGLFTEQPKGRFLPVLAAVLFVFGLMVEAAISYPAKFHFSETGRVMKVLPYLAEVSATCMAFGYLVAIVAAFRNLGWFKRVLAPLAPLGRMSLTTYLTQSLVCSIVFYGWGFGTWGKWTMAQVVGFAFALLVAQIAFSNLWFKRYAFGPAEWFWRGLTYGKFQPLKLRAK